MTVVCNKNSVYYILYAYLNRNHAIVLNNDDNNNNYNNNNNNNLKIIFTFQTFTVQEKYYTCEKIHL